MKCKLLSFDLDGTLLQTDKTISAKTMNALQKCRELGVMIGVSTSRSVQNSMFYISKLSPDIIIASGGAVVKNNDEYIYTAEFTNDETRNMIATARKICGVNCEITIDTLEEHFWNYKIDPNNLDANWGDSIYTDYSEFGEKALKMCVEIFDKEKANELAKYLRDCDCVKFSDGEWYKFTKREATKENAILRMCQELNITVEDIIAFGDDYVDIGMLKLCGVGVAMGNAIDEVKSVADVVIGGNDEDGIVEYLEESVIKR